MKKYFLFDLDGTLTDPGVGITNSVAYALKSYGITVEDRTSLYSFIGPPLKESFERFYGFSPEQADEAVGKYREYFGEKGLMENKAYDGILPMLEELKGKGARLLVATSKPTCYAREILENFGMLSCFEFVAGSNLDGSRVKKDEVIAYALQEMGICCLEEAVMIGDREHDIIGAKKCGISSIGVLYGYGSREELEKHGADRIVESVGELRTRLLSETEASGQGDPVREETDEA